MTILYNAVYVIHNVSLIPEPVDEGVLQIICLAAAKKLKLNKLN